MKNRILWIFEEQDAQQSDNSTDSFVVPQNAFAQNAFAQNESQHEENSNFAAVPAALFGALNYSDREAMTQIYRQAYAHTQAQKGARACEQARFERLLGDVCLAA